MAPTLAIQSCRGTVGRLATSPLGCNVVLSGRLRSVAAGIDGTLKSLDDTNVGSNFGSLMNSMAGVSLEYFQRTATLSTRLTARNSLFTVAAEVVLPRVRPRCRAACCYVNIKCLRRDIADFFWLADRFQVVHRYAISCTGLYSQSRQYLLLELPTEDGPVSVDETSRRFGQLVLLFEAETIRQCPLANLLFFRVPDAVYHPMDQGFPLPFLR